MEDRELTFPLERNQVTYRRHRREVFWQITIPITIGIILIVALAYLATQTNPDQASVWADISVIWLIAPIMTISLFSLALLIASIYLNVRLIKILPIYMNQAQKWFSLLAAQINRLDNKAVEPILRFQGFRASINMLGRNIRRK